VTGPVEFLQAAHKRAEETARATTRVPVPGKWSAVRDKHADDDAPLTLIQGHDEDDFDPQGYSSGRPVIAYAAEWQDEAEANLHHIALNDPHSVLCRVAAERKTLAEHEPTPADFDGTRRCLACGGYTVHPGVGSAGYRKVWPCPTIRNLAEGYGWTEEEQQ
jgi:hypothetical protein